MSERRRFLKMVAAGPAGAMLLPLFSETGSKTMAADVQCAADAIGRLPENIIYTSQHQGHWKGKAGGHVPKVEAVKRDDAVVLEIETKHGMSEKHYIVRHSVVNGLGEVLGAKTFHWDDKPVSRFEVKLPSGEQGSHLLVMSYCNLHDLWLAHTVLDV